MTAMTEQSSTEENRGALPEEECSVARVRASHNGVRVWGLNIVEHDELFDRVARLYPDLNSSIAGGGQEYHFYFALGPRVERLENRIRTALEELGIKIDDGADG